MNQLNYQHQSQSLLFRLLITSAQKEILVQIFKALSDPIRLTIIKMLYDANREMSCGEIGENIRYQ